MKGAKSKKSDARKIKIEQLVKPITIYSELEFHFAESLCNEHTANGGACKGHNLSIDTEGDLLF